MPTYDFTCDTCKKTEEHHFPIDGVAPMMPCECGGRMTKQFVPANVVYKGKGWAKKDRKGKKD